ncbi:hypothetical protein V6N13_125232 [Hibiscus sabdariffa]
MSYDNEKGIPEEAPKLDALHALTRQGKTEVNWLNDMQLGWRCGPNADIGNHYVSRLRLVGQLLMGTCTGSTRMGNHS